VNYRNAAGQATIALVFVIAFFIIGIVGLFGFEIARANLAREELRTACQSAAVAGAAAVAGSDDAETARMQTQALANALYVFKENAVLGMRQTNAFKVDGNPYTPKAGETALYFEFLDPHSNNAPVQIGNPNGKLVKVTAFYGLQPAFGKYLGLSNAPLQAVGVAGVPVLDIVLCFDVSGSIDDQTPVTFVKRLWNPTTSKIDYQVTSSAPGARAAGLAQGPLADILGPPPTGTGVNGLYPQELSTTDDGANRWKIYFSEQGGTNGATGLRGATNSGSPPGNFPGLGARTGTSYTFTDLVVNIDGKNSFSSFTADGYSFPDLATLVEASRGNLENDVVFKSSKADTSVTGVQPRAGYQAKYLEYAKKNAQPIAAAQDAAQMFFTILNNDTDAHFGLVAFSTNAGRSAGSTTSNYNIDRLYSQAGSSNFPLPQIVLDPTPKSTNYATVSSIIPTTVAHGSTNIGDAVDQAITMLESKQRAGSRRAIVVFTDGQPTAGGPLDGDPWSNARKAAVRAKSVGIPIYTIGLAQNPEVIPGEKAILNDWNSDPGQGGIAAIPGNGGRFFLVTNSKNLRLVFENLARQLVQLVRG